MPFFARQQSLVRCRNGIYGAQEIRLDIEDELAESSYPVGPAKHGAIHPNGRAFMTCSEGGEITWFDAESGDVSKKMQLSNVHQVGFTENGEEVVVAAKWGGDSFSRYDFETGKKKKAYSSKVIAKNGGLIGQFRKFMLGSDDGSSGTDCASAAICLDAELSKSEKEVQPVGHEYDLHV